MNQRAKIFGGVAVVVVILAGATLNYFIKNNLYPATGSGSLGYSDMSLSVRSAGVAPQTDESYGSVGKMFAADSAVREIYPPTPMPGGVAPEAENRLIIQTGSLSVVVDDVRAAVQAITALTTQKGGFVVSSYVSEEGIAPRASITVRIPAKEFAAGVDEAKKLGEVKNEQVSGQDVTAEYVDLDAQIRNLRATETQFLTIMQKAVEIKDVLSVQRELTIIRGQIEQIQGRMKYLSESASLSTLTINLSTDASALPVVDQKEQWKPVGVLKEAIRSLLNFGKSAANVIIWFVVYIPLWAILALVVWALYRWIGKKMNSGTNFKQ